jgi:hypothetical protein
LAALRLVAFFAAFFFVAFLAALRLVAFFAAFFFVAFLAALRLVAFFAAFFFVAFLAGGTGTTFHGERSHSTVTHGKFELLTSNARIGHYAREVCDGQPASEGPSAGATRRDG